jgi:hypothetical protein
MSENKQKLLQIHLLIFLLLLVIQFEFGMAVNLSKPPEISPFMFALNSLINALKEAGFAAIIHAILGTILTILAFISMILEVTTKIRKIQILGVLSLISTVLAELMGIFFVLSGFKNDNYSHGMATNFILSFVFNFFGLCLNKSIAITKEMKNHQNRISSH